MGRRNHRPASGPFRESFDGALDELWATIASGDVLHAEVQTSVFASLALMADGAEAVGPEKFADAVLDSAIRDQLTPESAAFCRLVVSLGTPALKREASRRLKEHTDNGVYPPNWVAAAGQAGAPRRVAKLRRLRRPGVRRRHVRLWRGRARDPGGDRHDHHPARRHLPDRER